MLPIKMSPIEKVNGCARLLGEFIAGWRMQQTLLYTHLMHLHDYGDQEDNQWHKTD